jgi:hypothetical protein
LSNYNIRKITKEKREGEIMPRIVNGDRLEDDILHNVPPDAAVRLLDQDSFVQ